MQYHYSGGGSATTYAGFSTGAFDGVGSGLS